MKGLQTSVLVFALIIMFLMLILSVAEAAQEDSGVGFFGPSHADVDQSAVVKPILPRKRVKRGKHPRCIPNKAGEMRCR
jgi:hypothetical protein